MNLEGGSSAGVLIVRELTAKRKHELLPELPPALREERHPAANEIDLQHEPAKEVESEQTVGVGAEREVVGSDDEVGSHATESGNGRDVDERCTDRTGHAAESHVTDRARQIDTESAEGLRRKNGNSRTGVERQAELPTAPRADDRHRYDELGRAGRK